MKNYKKHKINPYKSKINISIILLAFLAFSCNDDNMKQVEKNDCQVYSPNSFTNTITDSWEKINERKEHIDAIVIPEDAGGGYVKVELTQSDPDLRPTLSVSIAGSKIIGGSSTQTNNKLNRVAYFSVYPGMKYSLKTFPFFNAAAYPVDYTITWDFVSQMDCFEPNDTKTDAKKVLIDDTIEAYAIAGHKEYFVSSFAEQTYDWYKVELKEPGQLKIEVLDLPKDIRIVTRVFSQDNDHISSDFLFTGSDFGASFDRGRTSINTTSNVLDPGVYYIELHPDFFEHGKKANSDLDPIPDHFNKTYKMKVTSL